MKILYLTYGGQSHVVEYLAAALRARGARVEVCDVARGISYRSRRFKLPSFKPFNLLNTLTAVVRYRKAWKFFFLQTTPAFCLMSRRARRAALKAQRNGFDLILQSGAVFSAHHQKLGIPCCPYLDHTHQLSEEAIPVPGLAGHTIPAAAAGRWREQETLVYRKAARVFTMSRNVERSLVGSYGIPPEKISVIGAGPNFEGLPEVREKQYDGKTILFVGIGFALKGGEYLLEAFRTVRREIGDARLLIVGSAPRVSEPGVESFGLVEHAKVFDFYRRASIFVLPGLREAFGLAFLEAMAFRLPCIGTRIEAIPEIIEDGRTGFLVPPMDSGTLAAKMVALLRDKALMSAMGNAGRLKVENQYNWPVVAGKLLAVHSSALRRTP